MVGDRFLEPVAGRLPTSLPPMPEIADPVHAAGSAERVFQCLQRPAVSFAAARFLARIFAQALSDF